MNPSILLVGLILLGAPQAPATSQEPAPIQDPVVIRVVREVPHVQSVAPVAQTGVVSLKATPTTHAVPTLLDNASFSSSSSGCETNGACCGNGCSVGCGCGDGCGPGCGRIRFDLRHPPTNMIPHLPYDAQPKTYYYFRPYNWIHISQHQGEAAVWNAPPGNPYSNQIFEEIYKSIEIEEIMGDASEESIEE